MNAFEKPQHPTGYVVFDFDTKCFRGKYLHLADIKTFCIAHNIAPTDIIILRTFGPIDSDYNRKIVSIDEYAHRHFFHEPVGDFHIEREQWLWHPQPELPEETITKNILTTIYAKFLLFCVKVREFFSFSF